MPYYTEALEAHRRTLGNAHPSTLMSIKNMGILLKIQGKYDEAMPYYTEALEARRRIFGDDHPDTNTSLKAMIKFQNQWHEAEPDAGHDAIAAKYQAQLDAINAGLEMPAAP